MSAVTTINVWQAEALARIMRDHNHPDDDSLRSAYAKIELRNVEDERVLFITFEDGGTLALWHDGSDVTDEYVNPTERIA